MPVHFELFYDRGKIEIVNDQITYEGEQGVARVRCADNSNMARATDLLTLFDKVYVDCVAWEKGLPLDSNETETPAFEDVGSIKAEVVWESGYGQTEEGMPTEKVQGKVGYSINGNVVWTGIWDESKGVDTTGNGHKFAASVVEVLKVYEKWRLANSAV